MLILDIDDTLVPRGGGISQKNAAAIQKAREAFFKRVRQACM